MKIRASGPVPEHRIVLRGQGRALPSRAARSRVAQTKAAGSVEVSAVSEPARPQRSPLALEIAEIRLHPRGGGRLLLLLLLCRLAGSSSGQLPSRVAVQAGGQPQRAVAVDQDGRFHLGLRVTAGTDLRVAALDADGKCGAFVALGKVPVMLRVEGARARIRCVPEQRFLLVAHADGKGLQVWRGRADTAGRRAVGLGVLGAAANCDLSLTVVTEIDGVLETSPAVVIDRAKR